MPIPFDQAPLAEQGERLVAQIDEDRPQMNHRHRKILHAFFAHPVNSNIHFRDVEKLFQELGAEVTHSHTGRLHLSLNRHSANFPTAWHSIPKEEVVRMRKFIEQCGIDPQRDYPLHDDGAH